MCYGRHSRMLRDPCAEEVKRQFLKLPFFHRKRYIRSRKDCLQQVSRILGINGQIVRAQFSAGIGCGYILRENQLAKETAESLANGEYRDRDIILTISSEDLPRRITGLNRMAFA